MICGSITFVLGCIMMPWVFGFVIMFYFLGIVSRLKSIWNWQGDPVPPPNPFMRGRWQWMSQLKLCKVRSVQFGQKGIPYLNTYDGRTIRYPDPLIKANDTVKLDLEANKIVDFIKFDVGNVVMVTGGRNRGRVGVIKNREKHKGTFETVHVQDAAGHEFATRLGNVFIVGKGTKPWISLPKGKGIKLSIIEEARKRLTAAAASAATA